jgi:hypothetical protein
MALPKLPSQVQLLELVLATPWCVRSQQNVITIFNKCSIL